MLVVLAEKKALRSGVIFARLGAYVLITLAVLSSYAYAAHDAKIDWGFLASAAIVIFAQIISKSPLISFAVGFLSHILITIFF